MLRALGAVARHGRLCLIAGLLLGLGFPRLAEAVRPWLPEFVALIIFVAALRIGARDALGGPTALPRVVATVLVLQLVLPLGLATGALILWDAAPPVVLAVVLMTAAPSISGSPNLTILLGHDPAPALRLVIVGTALFPFTVLPVLWCLPGIRPDAAMRAGLVLFATIVAVTGAAFLARSRLRSDRADDARTALDGAGALLMGIMVIGLLDGLSPMLRDDPIRAVGWVALAAAANLGLQLVAHAMLPEDRGRVATAVVAGNRNIALFLIALPTDLTDAILPFIGAYQLPMYLTPMLMAAVYGRAAGKC